MLKKPYLCTAAIVVLFLLCASQFVQAQIDDATNNDVLKGLKSVLVSTSLSPVAEKFGLTPLQVQTDTELKLRTAGLHIVEEPEWKQDHSSAGGGWVDLQVTVVLYDDGTQQLLGYSIHLKLMQPVTLNRDTSISTFATTWSTGGVGIFTPTSFPEKLRARIRDKLDEFVNCYMAANPK
jgi:hypothetical protein